MNQMKIGTGTFAVTTFLLLVLLGGAFLYQQTRVHQVEQREQALDQQLTSAQGDLSDARSRVEALEGQVAKTTKDVHRVGETVDKQAAQTLDVKAVTKRALPSVVTVYCGDLQGSGFAIAVNNPPTGYKSAIVTNYHVIAQCTRNDGTEPTVRQGDLTPETTLWSWDDTNDLALLFVALDVPPLETAGTPEQGDPVVAIGSPYGLDESVTTGVVSQIYDDFFQTDATINPGNSGGPLLDRTGKVLGVTTFKLGDQGTNFAVRMRVRCDELINC
jgi:S1-C subfamily serine protease